MPPSEGGKARVLPPSSKSLKGYEGKKGTRRRRRRRSAKARPLKKGATRSRGKGPERQAEGPGKKDFATPRKITRIHASPDCK